MIRLFGMALLAGALYYVYKEIYCVVNAESAFDRETSKFYEEYEG